MPRIKGKILGNEENTTPYMERERERQVLYAVSDAENGMIIVGGSMDIDSENSEKGEENVSGKQISSICEGVENIEMSDGEIEDNRESFSAGEQRKNIEISPDEIPPYWCKILNDNKGHRELDAYYSDPERLTDGELLRFSKCIQASDQESAWNLRRRFKIGILQGQDLIVHMRDIYALEALCMHLACRKEYMMPISHYTQIAIQCMRAQEIKLLFDLPDEITQDDGAREIIGQYSDLSKILIKEYLEHLGSKRCCMQDIYNTLRRLYKLEEKIISKRAQDSFSEQEIRSIKMILTFDIAFNIKKNYLDELDMDALDLLKNNLKDLYIGLLCVPQRNRETLRSYIQRISSSYNKEVHGSQEVEERATLSNIDAQIAIKLAEANVLPNASDSQNSALIHGEHRFTPRL